CRNGVVEPCEQLLIDLLAGLANIFLHDLAQARDVLWELQAHVETAPQKWLGQPLFAIAGDDYYGSRACALDVPSEAPLLHRLLGLVLGKVVDCEFETVEDVEQIVGKVDVSLVDFVDEHDAALGRPYGLAERLERDVRIDVARLRVLRI